MATPWDKSMETGNEMIDRQHREAFKLLDELRRIQVGPEDDARRVIDEFMEFTTLHFLAEEMLMAQVGYPADLAEEQAGQHQWFKDNARRRVLQFRMGDKAGLLSLHAHFYDWLANHELALDKKLADWIHARENEPAIR